MLTRKQLRLLENKLEKHAVKENHLDGALSQLFLVKKPEAGCANKDLVKTVDPLVGVQDSEIVPDQIHAMYPQKDVALSVAEALCNECMQQEQALEEKKHKVTEKLKKAINGLEKMRTESMNLIKEEPAKAGQHKDSVAQLTSKIDEYMTSLEKVAKSIKTKDKKNKDNLKEDLAKQDNLSSAQYQKEKRKKGFKESDWKWNPNQGLYNRNRKK
jgi:hypothetical protein